MTQTASRPVHSDTLSLEGKAAIVTGSTTGIGRATALLMAQQGARVVVCGRNEQALQDTLRDLEQTGGEALGVTADNAYEDQIERVFRETHQKFGDIDILVNNAALPAKSILDTDYDQALYVIRTNIMGYLAYMQKAVEMMRRKGEGHIVNIGSMSVAVDDPGADIYVATKGAIRGISRSMRKILAKEKIKISLIEPGLVGTNLHGEPPEDAKQAEQIEKGEMLKAEDIAATIGFILTQPERSHVLEVQIAPLQQAL